MASEAEQKKWTAQEYLGKHSVHSLFEKLTAELILHKPNAPLDYMAGRVTQMQNNKPLLRPTIVFLLGPPGSGRGTQGTKIMDQFGFKHIVAGDVLRREALKGSDEGRSIDQIIRAGGLVPSHIAIPLVIKEIGQHPAGTSFLIDGFPRELAQVVAFETQLCECRFALYLDCSDEVCRQRLADRGAALNAAADAPDMVDRRLETFRNDGYPAVQYLEALGKVHRIDASGTVEEVWNQVEPLFQPLP